MLNRNEIISRLNYARDLLPKENEITDNLIEVIHQLEDEWKSEFKEEEI